MVAPGQPPWAGPVPRRFHTVAGAPLNVRAPLLPALGDLVLADPLSVSEIRFDDVVARLGLGGPLQPGGGAGIQLGRYLGGLRQRWSRGPARGVQ